MNAPFIPQKELSKKWESLTGAAVCDIRKLRGNAIGYISKYLSKSNSVAYTRQRVSFSRNWPKEERKKLDLEAVAEWNTFEIVDEVELGRFTDHRIGVTEDLGNSGYVVWNSEIESEQTNLKDFVEWKATTFKRFDELDW